jgi:sterol desaturase/sphingolipid hydroxylase (fatty acid hydroxylase superfamily)
LSALSAIVFALSAALIMSGYDWGATLLYTDLHQYGLWYLGVSFGAVLVLQDGYFYFTHRAFHHPLLFKWLHQGHHRSGDPTPWTSFAFDLPEAIVQALFLVGIVFIVPLHFVTLIAWLMTMTLWTVLNHLGFELFPTSFPRHWLGRWFIGPTHHAIHHRNYVMHYGLYFTVWDRLLGTHHAAYETEFDALLRDGSKRHLTNQTRPTPVALDPPPTFPGV